MKKCLALLLVIIMTCSVFSVAGVVAAPKANAASAGKKYVVFRDDDVYLHEGSASGEVNVLKAINQVHINKNVPVSLGIVSRPNDAPDSGNQLLKEPIHSYLKSLTTNSLFELAQHGRSHIDYSTSSAGVSVGPESGGSPNSIAGEVSSTPNGVSGATIGGYSEFRGRPYADQYNDIKLGRDDITQALGVTPTTFIPPWNSGDGNTLKALAGLGFKLYSTGDDDFQLHQAVVNGITVQGYSWCIGWDTLSEWQTNLPSITQDMDAKLNSASAGQYFVVYYHDWTFEKSDGSLDSARITLFSQYLDHLKNRGDVTFTTLGGQQLPSSPTLQSTTLTITSPTGTQSSGATYTVAGDLKDINNNPVANAPVDVFVDSSDTGSWHWWKTVTTDGSGHWSTTDHHTSAGVYYEARYWGDGSHTPAATDRWVTIQPASGATTLTITSPTGTQTSGRSYTVAGDLKDSSNKPVANAPVDVFVDSSDTGSWHWWELLYTDGNGHWSTTDHHVAAGVYYEARYWGDGSHTPSEADRWVTIG